jgi:hypothetical protein
MTIINAKSQCEHCTLQNILQTFPGEAGKSKVNKFYCKFLLSEMKDGRSGSFGSCWDGRGRMVGGGGGWAWMHSGSGEDETAELIKNKLTEKLCS